jgi:hypothetical protein
MSDLESNWADSTDAVGRLPFWFPDAAEISGIVELARNALATTAPDARDAFLKALNGVLAGFAESIAWRRTPTSFGAVCTRFQWWPINGGLTALLTDVHVLADKRLLAYRPFVLLSRQVARDPHRAFVILLALVVIRDEGQLDRASVLDARALFDLHTAQLIARDGNTHAKRRASGQHRAADIQSRCDRMRHEVERLAIKLTRSGTVEGAKLVSSVDAGLGRAHDAPTYPSKRTIRRILKQAGLLPAGVKVGP